MYPLGKEVAGKGRFNIVWRIGNRLRGLNAIVFVRSGEFFFFLLRSIDVLRSRLFFVRSGRCRFFFLVLV